MDTRTGKSALRTFCIWFETRSIWMLRKDQCSTLEMLDAKSRRADTRFAQPDDSRSSYIQGFRAIDLAFATGVAACVRSS